jgi:hypothetical protein
MMRFVRESTEGCPPSSWIQLMAPACVFRQVCLKREDVLSVMSTEPLPLASLSAPLLIGAMARTAAERTQTLRGAYFPFFAMTHITVREVSGVNVVITWLMSCYWW